MPVLALIHYISPSKNASQHQLQHENLTVYIDTDAKAQPMMITS